MNMLVITAIKEFEGEVKKILFDAGIKEFTCADVTGCRDASAESVADNWFAGEMNETGSMLFWVFAPEGNAHRLEEKVDKFNAGRQSDSRIHVAILKTEKYI